MIGMRMRTVKPEFWRNEAIKDQPREYRLLLVGLYSYVDDNGVGLDDHRQIAAALFPLEDDPVEVREFVREGLASLSRGFLLTRFCVDGVSYVYVNDWDEIQKIDKPNKARFPRPPGDPGSVTSENEKSCETFASDSRDSPESPSPGVLEYRSIKSRSSAGADEDFDAFWAAYPRKVAKKEARKCWRKAIDQGADPAVLIQAAKRYQQARQGEPARFTKHPTTWLNQGCWDDEDLHPPGEDPGDPDPAVVLGPDCWSPPAAPFEVEFGDEDQRQTWYRQQFAERHSQRVAQAREVLAQRGTA